MKFKTTTMYVLLIFSVLTILSSCTGQINSKKLDVQNNGGTIGKIVSELDEKIWVVYQDQRNNYWFGSNGNGVYRYDGKNLNQFTKTNGLIGNQIRGIQEDKSGNVYFDTPDGVSKFDGLIFATLEPIYSSKNEWKSELDDLWFKGNGDINGVYRYDGKSLFHLEFPEYDLEIAFGMKFYDSPYSPYGVYNIYKDKKDNLWFGTLSAGVYRYNGESQLWISEKELSQLDNGAVPGVRSIIEDKEGIFWLSNTLNRYKIDTENGIIKYQKLKGIETLNGQDKMDYPYFLSAVIDDINNDLWMVTYDEGVWRYDGKNLFHYPIKDGEKDALLFTIYKDNQGVLWLGSHNAGAFRFNGKKFEKFEPNKEKSSH